jgi:hypothetical protein
MRSFPKEQAEKIMSLGKANGGWNWDSKQKPKQSIANISKSQKDHKDAVDGHKAKRNSKKS